MTDQKSYPDADERVSGNIFDIKRFATDDGPGIRTLIFLKGCPLSCKWCANPESQKALPEIMYYKKKCTGCGKCIKQCPANAIRQDKRFGLIIDKRQCTLCGKCADACVYGAREIIGKPVTVAQVMEIISKDLSFYKNTGGGITLSGGEPLLQSKFSGEILKAAKKRNINTAIETSGFAKWADFKPLLPFLDLIFYDLKHIDPECHRGNTGVRNDVIMENLKNLNDQYMGELVVRIPFIPGINSEEQTQNAMFAFVAKLCNVKRIEIMPYHRFGLLKYEGLGMEYALKDLEPIDKNTLRYLIDLGKECGVEIKIGGDY